MNNDINPLLAAAQAAFGGDDKVIKPVENTNRVNDIVPTKDSTKPEILDWIMIFLCERTKVEYNYFQGGYVLTKLLPEDAIMTEDIDFSVSTEKQYRDLMPILDEMGKALMEYGVIDSYKVRDSIEVDRSGGIKMHTPGNMKDIKIDIDWCDLSYGVQKWDCLGFECNRFEIERMLSDKLMATYSPKRFRRTKDIYDFYILTDNFDVDLDKLKLCLDNHGSLNLDENPFKEEYYEQYYHAYDMLTLRHINSGYIDKPKFKDVMGRLYGFMEKYLTYSYKRWSYLDHKMY